MLPQMANKPSIAIVGPGKLGMALALALRERGYRIEAVIGPPGKTSMRAKRLAKQVRSRALREPKDIHAEILWLCVPDAEIARAAKNLAPIFRGRFAFHSSGALSSDELTILRGSGTPVASVHPLMTFVEGANPPLEGVSFAIEGDIAAVRAARVIVRDLGGESYTIDKATKNAYHAWGTFASPLLTALLATAEHVAGLARVKGKTARHRMLPILRQTVENYGKSGAGPGFSGPIVRGDLETIRRHLAILRRSPVPEYVYLALARAALEYLPSKKRKAIERLLNFA